MLKKGRHIHQDLLMAMILFIAAIGFFVGSFFIPKASSVVSNIHMFPRLISGVLIIFSIFNLYYGIKNSRELNQQIEAADQEIVPEISLGKLKEPLIGICFILVYTIGVAAIGFFVSSAIFLFAFISYLGYRRYWVTLLIIAGLEAFIYILFVITLNTRLPVGILF